MSALEIKPGEARGLVVGDPDIPVSDFPATVLRFDAEQLTETKMPLRDVQPPDPDDDQVTWVRIMSLPDKGALADFGLRWELDPLDLEDVIDVGQRPKTELKGGKRVFTVMQIPSLDEAGALGLRQVNLFLGPNYVVSIFEGGDPVFNLVAQRVHSGGRSGRIRRNGAEYLFYALVSAAIDHAYPVLDVLGQVVDELEETLVQGDEHGAMDAIHRVRREVNALRRSQWPAREAIERLARSEDSPMSKRAKDFMRDSLDHQIQINDQIDGVKEELMRLQDLHLSLQGQRLNEVMRVLTIIATIFIPLSFFTGLYGMNFDPEVSPWNMPELGTRYGYPVLLLFLASLVVGMIIYFRRRRWF